MHAARFAAGRIRALIIWGSLHAEPTGDLLIQFADLTVVKVQLAELALQQEAVMFPEGALHRLGQLVALVAQAPARQFSKPLGILLPVEQGLQDGPT